MTLLPTEESRAYRAEALPMAVVYEDDDLLVIDKEAGLVVHPAAGNWSGTCSTACSIAIRRARPCRAPASSIASTRTPAA